MELSQYTLSVLKNFAQINTSLLIKSGNVLRTISPQKTILAKANVDMEFDNEFCIHDLGKFLGVLSLFDHPDLTISEKSVLIKSGRQRVSYTCGDPSMIVTPPAKDIVLAKPEVEFELTPKALQNLIRAQGALQVNEIAIRGNGEVITVCAVDTKNPTSDVYSDEVGVSDHTFNMVIKAEYLRTLLIANPYKVSLSSKGLAHFANDEIEYWIAIEAGSSKFGG